MANIRTGRMAFFDAAIFFIIFSIGVMGILTIYSATQGTPHREGISIYQKQMIWWGLGFIGMLVVVLIDSRHIEHYAYAIYGFSVMLLAYVLFFGRTIAGAKRWVELGPLQFQPSELMKVTMVLALAKYFQRHGRDDNYSLYQLTVPFLIFFVPFLLVLLEPDLGTSLVLLLIFFSIIFFLGLTGRSILTLFLVGMASLPIGWFSLKEYQKDRVMTFLNPSRDPLGSGYHIIQSKVAIGSGGFWGKGYLNGTQTRLRFLPEQHTDFIFSSFAEEWGFLGSLLLLGGYLVVIIWALNGCSRLKNNFGLVVFLGITFLLFWHVIINIGMCLALLPVVGIPLPFFSYGGSFMLIMFLAIGLLLNIYLRRFIF